MSDHFLHQIISHWYWYVNESLDTWIFCEIFIAWDSTEYFEVLSKNKSRSWLYRHKLFYKPEIICTCVILSLFPSQLSLSSYRGSLLLPMKIGSQWTKLPVLLPTWNTWRSSVSGASCHSLLRGTLWQPEHNFLWKGIAVPAFSIWTWNENYLLNYFIIFYTKRKHFLLFQNFWKHIFKYIK